MKIRWRYNEDAWHYDIDTEDKAWITPNFMCLGFGDWGFSWYMLEEIPRKERNLDVRGSKRFPTQNWHPASPGIFGNRIPTWSWTSYYLWFDRTFTTFTCSFDQKWFYFQEPVFHCHVWWAQGVHMHMHPDGPKVVCQKIGGAPQPSGCENHVPGLTVNPMVWKAFSWPVYSHKLDVNLKTIQ